MDLFSDVIHGGHGDEETLAEAKEFAKGFEYSKKDGWEPDTHSLSDPTFSGNCLKEKELPLITKFIHSTLIQYLERLGHSQNTVQGFDIVESWLTNTKNGEYARQHHHGTADVSGVYYIQSNPDTDGNLYFLASDVVRTAKVLYQMLPSQHDIQPIENQLVLFPGWMNHGTRIHQGTEDRISLSFNIKLFL